MVPVRDALFFHEIVDANFVSSLGAMVEFSLSIHFQGPDPVSPHVYWWRDRSISRLVAYENGRTLPVWGDEFSETISELEAALQPAVMN